MHYLSPGSSFHNIVNVQSTQEPGLDLIEPADPGASYLVQKVRLPWWLSHTTGHLELSNASIQMLGEWVEDGAKDN